MKVFYKTTTCPRRPLLSGPKSGCLIQVWLYLVQIRVNCSSNLAKLDWKLQNSGFKVKFCLSKFHFYSICCLHLKLYVRKDNFSYQLFSRFSYPTNSWGCCRPNFHVCTWTIFLALLWCLMQMKITVAAFLPLTIHNVLTLLW